MLNCPTEDEIVRGLVTDHCCTLSLEVLRRLGIADRIVTLEAHVRRFPPGISRGIYYGIDDVIKMVQGRDVKVWSMAPGSFFFEREPVLILEGSAEILATIRPSVTGALTFGSSIVTRANDFVRIAKDKPVFFFGLRKLHPAHVRQYLECAYVAGMEINTTLQALAIFQALD
jgi:nicotinate phosphoribosyltransferase